MNFLKTTFLMTLLTVLFVFIGHTVGGRNGAIFFLILAGGMNFFTYWLSDRIVLAMYRAREVTKEDAPRLYRVVHRLTQRANLPMPRLYVIPTEVPNAFATGRNPSHAAVAATEGIMRLLTEEEMEAVLSHELAHVKHRDILIATIVATLAGAVTLISRIALFFGGSRDRSNPLVLLLVVILAPIAAILIQLAISRSREYSADAGGARISGKPLALAAALAKIHGYARAYPLDVNPSTAHLFIVNPLRGSGIGSLFSTHPPVEERIERLQRMAQEGF